MRLQLRNSIAQTVEWKYRRQLFVKDAVSYHGVAYAGVICLRDASICPQAIRQYICAACRLKKNQNVRQSAQGVVTEVELPIDDRDVAFESCVQRNADAIRRVVDEHQYRLR